MYIEYDLVALRRLYKEFRIKQIVLARWIGVSRETISKKIKSENNSTASWQDETLDNSEMKILLNMIKSGKTFDQNKEKSLIVNIGINYKHKSYAVFIKNNNKIKCLFEFTGILNDQLTSIGFFKYGPIGVGIIEQLNKICNVEDASDFPNVQIENEDLYYKVISEARNFEMTKFQYVKFLGFTLLDDDKEVKPTPVEQNKIIKRAEYRAILQEHYLVKDNQVYFKSSDPFYKRLYNNAIRQSPPITLKELLGGLGFKMISVKHLPSDYVPYDWVKDNEGAFDEDDFQSTVESGSIDDITIYNEPTDTNDKVKAVIVEESIALIQGQLDFQLQVDQEDVPDDVIVIDRPKDKPSKTSSSGVSSYKRDAKISKIAIVSAKYKCEINETHVDFISKVTGKNYVEAHHLIPMEFQDEKEFAKSIDVEANIVSLCVGCHKKLHHGTNEVTQPLIEKLYNERIDRLKHCGIWVDKNDLLNYYK